MVEKSKENLSFQAEVSKLLDLVANSLYSEREIFLRELISNAADACEKLRYQSLSKKNLLKDEKDLKINIRVSKKKKIIEIEDNGIGMAKQDLIDNLGKLTYGFNGAQLQNLFNEASIRAIRHDRESIEKTIADRLQKQYFDDSVDTTIPWASAGESEE